MCARGRMVMSLRFIDEPVNESIKEGANVWNPMLDGELARNSTVCYGTKIKQTPNGVARIPLYISRRPKALELLEPNSGFARIDHRRPAERTAQ